MPPSPPRVDHSEGHDVKATEALREDWKNELFPWRQIPNQRGRAVTGSVQSRALGAGRSRPGAGSGGDVGAGRVLAQRVARESEGPSPGTATSVFELAPAAAPPELCPPDRPQEGVLTVDDDRVVDPHVAQPQWQEARRVSPTVVGHEEYALAVPGAGTGHLGWSGRGAEELLQDRRLAPVDRPQAESIGR